MVYKHVVELPEHHIERKLVMLRYLVVVHRLLIRIHSVRIPLKPYRCPEVPGTRENVLISKLPRVLHQVSKSPARTPMSLGRDGATPYHTILARTPPKPHSSPQYLNSRCSMLVTSQLLQSSEITKGNVDASKPEFFSDR